jgi:hypothetical protein
LLKHLEYHYNLYLNKKQSGISEFNETEILKYSRLSQIQLLINVLNKM